MKVQNSSVEVSRFYDDGVDLFTELWGDNLHMGYWTDESDGSSIEVATERMNDLLISLLTPRPGQRILDVGCGVGTPAVRLATAHPVEVVGISVSGQQLGRANARAREAGLADRLRFEHADAMALPYPDGSFDAAWAVESLVHVADKAQALREIARVLRPGSRFVVADFFCQSCQEPSPKTIMTPVRLHDYRELIEQAGMSLVELTDITKHAIMPKSCIAITQAKVLTRRDVIVARYGEEVVEKAMTSMPYPSGYGYVLLTVMTHR